MKEFDEIREELTARYPRLLAEWDALLSRPAHEGGDFLDKHFPIEGGWGGVRVTDAPELLRNWKPK